LKRLLALAGQEEVADFRDHVRSGVRAGREVDLGDWGRITVHRKPAAESLDPRTGRTRTLPERWHVGMASGPLTKDVIAGRGVSETRSTGRVLGLIARVLLDGGTLEMPGVGTFELVHKEGYQGRARGRVVTRPPRTVLMFRLDDGLRADMESRRR